MIVAKWLSQLAIINLAFLEANRNGALSIKISRHQVLVSSYEGPDDKTGEKNSDADTSPTFKILKKFTEK